MPSFSVTRSIIVVENEPAVGFLMQHQLFLHRAEFDAHGIPWAKPQLCPSPRRLHVWLDADATTNGALLLVDYAMYGGSTGSQLISTVRQHRAVQPSAKSIGWSAHTTVTAEFRAQGADGFYRNI